MHNRYSRPEDLLGGQSASEHIKVASLNAGRLVEYRSCLEVRRVRDEGRALLSVLEGYVSGNRAALEKDETIVVDVGHLAERLLLKEACCLLLGLGTYVDGHELEGNPLLKQHRRDAPRASRGWTAEELEDHGGESGCAGVLEAGADEDAPVEWKPFIHLEQPL